jgi:dihydroorotate dehydrogenase (fumarate)
MSADMRTYYLGLPLANPLVASASPRTRDVESIRALEQAGIAAVVLPSLFEEQISRDEQRLYAVRTGQPRPSSESLACFPDMVHPDEYLATLEAAKRAVRAPVIASLNGCTPGGWARFAKLFQEAGADAVEMNIYSVPTDPRQTAYEVEARQLELVATVRQAVRIPVAVKIGAQYSSLPNFVARLVDAGANGVVLFNRLLEPDIDVDAQQVVPQLTLSSRHESRLPLRWIGILRDQLSISLAATTGIHRSEDVLKLLLAGADVCQLATVLLARGPAYVSDLLEEIRNWLELNGYQSVEQLKGSMSYGNSPDAGPLERANYMKAIASYTAVH